MTDEIEQKEPLAAEEAALRHRLEEFKSLLDTHQIRERHFPADIVLAGLGASVWDAGNAVVLIAQDARHMSSAFPVARLAFETGMDALYLATSPDYDQAGAKAYVFERIEYADVRTDLGLAFAITEFGPAEAEYDEAASSIREMAQKLELARPGMGEELRSALDNFLPKFQAARLGARHPGNWAELSRRRMGQELEKRDGTAGVATRLKAAYSSLSRSSHPRLRLESWEPNPSQPGPALRQKVRSGVVALRMVELGVDLVANAFRSVKSDPS